MRGEAIRALSMEGRMTVCNMSIEAGARAGMVAPDEKTFAYLEGRPKSPKGAAWDMAMKYWQTLKSDEGAHFDREVKLDAAKLPPIVTWGTSPEDVATIEGAVPDPGKVADEGKRAKMARALDYMGLTPGTKIVDIPLDVVWIGSCTNGRIEDLRNVAKVVEGKKVSSRLAYAMIVPGSGLVKQQAEAGGPRQDLPRCGLRVARGWLLDVPRHEPRSAQARAALRIHLQPQLRGPAGLSRPHAPRLAADGGGGGDRRPLRGRAGIWLRGLLAHRNGPWGKVAAHGKVRPRTVGPRPRSCYTARQSRQAIWCSSQSLGERRREGAIGCRDAYRTSANQHHHRTPADVG